MTIELNLRPTNKGTDYSKPSSTRSIYVEELGLFMSKPLATGNTKLSKDILIFDLLAIETCLSCAACASSCYAMKAQRQYVETYNKRAINTFLARHHVEVLEREIMKQLSHSTKPFVRIHSSGDFFSQEYIDMWQRIIESFPTKKFYTYSKVVGMFDFDGLFMQHNFNLIDSILPDGDINYGDFEYITKKSYEFDAPICPYGIDEHTEPVHCGKTCTLCMEHEFVLFLKH